MMALNKHLPSRHAGRKSWPVDSSESKDIKSHQPSMADEALRLIESIDTPRALTVYLLFTGGEHQQLLSLGCSPEQYLNAEAFRLDYLATRLLQKSDLLRVDIDKAAVAYATEAAAEVQCTVTNKRFDDFIRTGIFFDAPDDVYWLIARMRKIIRQVLGEFPPTKLMFGGFTTGRTTSAWGVQVTAVDKFGSQPDITVHALSYGVELLNSSPTWVQEYLDADGPCSLIHKVDALPLVAGNVAFTVPKSAKTDRFCCYEPHLNVVLQRAVGAQIGRRLKRFGIDLSDQSLNQSMALNGSRDGSLATIDLSSASDTVSHKLVEALLSEEWFDLLNRLRSHTTRLPDGTIRRNQKFSSMGNGFTFELESLIFYAALRATHESLGYYWESQVSGSVFGDDIICEHQVADKLLSNLEFLGFIPNKGKTFTCGPFRESCGVDAYCGILVTPFYIRPQHKGQFGLRCLHNRLVEWASRLPHQGSEVFFNLAASWRLTYPDCCGPHGYGDGHYIAPFEEVKPSRAPGGVEGFWFNTRTPIYRLGALWCYGGMTDDGRVLPPSFPLRHRRTAILAALWNLEQTNCDNSSIQRQWDIISYGTKKIRVLCSDWTRIGLRS